MWHLVDNAILILTFLVKDLTDQCCTCTITRLYCPLMVIVFSRWASPCTFKTDIVSDFLKEMQKWLPIVKNSSCLMPRAFLRGQYCQTFISPSKLHTSSISIELPTYAIAWKPNVSNTGKWRTSHPMCTAHSRRNNTTGQHIVLNVASWTDWHNTKNNILRTSLHNTTGCRI
jgi:hypothetical protein